MAGIFYSEPKSGSVELHLKQTAVSLDKIHFMLPVFVADVTCTRRLACMQHGRYRCRAGVDDDDEKLVIAVIVDFVGLGIGICIVA